MAEGLQTCHSIQIFNQIGWSSAFFLLGYCLIVPFISQSHCWIVYLVTALQLHQLSYSCPEKMNWSLCLLVHLYNSSNHNGKPHSLNCLGNQMNSCFCWRIPLPHSMARQLGGRRPPLPINALKDPRDPGLFSLNLDRHLDLIHCQLVDYIGFYCPYSCSSSFQLQ